VLQIGQLVDTSDIYYLTFKWRIRHRLLRASELVKSIGPEKSLINRVGYYRMSQRDKNQELKKRPNSKHRFSIRQINPVVVRLGHFGHVADAASVGMNWKYPGAETAQRFIRSPLTRLPDKIVRCDVRSV
jgi:hypothetical protein